MMIKKLLFLILLFIGLRGAAQEAPLEIRQQRTYPDINRLEYVESRNVKYILQFVSSNILILINLDRKDTLSITALSPVPIVIEANDRVINGFVAVTSLKEDVTIGIATQGMKIVGFMISNGKWMKVYDIYYRQYTLNN